MEEVKEATEQILGEGDTADRELSPRGKEGGENTLTTEEDEQTIVGWVQDISTYGINVTPCEHFEPQYWRKSMCKACFNSQLDHERRELKQPSGSPVEEIRRIPDTANSPTLSHLRNLRSLREKKSLWESFSLSFNCSEEEHKDQRKIDAGGNKEPDEVEEDYDDLKEQQPQETSRGEEKGSGSPHSPAARQPRRRLNKEDKRLSLPSAVFSPRDRGIFSSPSSPQQQLPTSNSYPYSPRTMAMMTVPVVSPFADFVQTRPASEWKRNGFGEYVRGVDMFISQQRLTNPVIPATSEAKKTEGVQRRACSLSHGPMSRSSAALLQSGSSPYSSSPSSTPSSLKRDLRSSSAAVAWTSSAPNSLSTQMNIITQMAEGESKHEEGESKHEEAENGQEEQQPEASSLMKQLEEVTWKLKEREEEVSQLKQLVQQYQLRMATSSKAIASTTTAVGEEKLAVMPAPEQNTHGYGEEEKEAMVEEYITVLKREEGNNPLIPPSPHVTTSTLPNEQVVAADRREEESDIAINEECGESAIRTNQANSCTPLVKQRVAEATTPTSSPKSSLPALTREATPRTAKLEAWQQQLLQMSQKTELVVQQQAKKLNFFLGEMKYLQQVVAQFQEDELNWRAEKQSMTQIIEDLHLQLVSLRKIKEQEELLRKFDINKVVPAQRLIRCWLRRNRQREQATPSVASIVEAYSQSKDAGPAKQRWRTLMDLITSEREYVAALSDCIQNYLRPLQEAAKPDNKQGHGLTMQELSIVFRNIELIHSLHVHLLAELEERVIKSTTATTTGTSFMCIGDIMLKVLPSLSIYAQYHKKRHHAFEMYCAWVARTDFANSTLAPLQKDKESSLIVSLDRPLERVSQYRSFLQKLLRYTPSTHVDRPRLVEARSATSSLLQLLEESWEFGRTKYKMRSLQHTLHGLPPLITTTDEKDTKVNNNPTSISFFDPWARRWIGDTDWVLLTSPNITLVDERPAQDLISPRGRAALSGKFNRSASRQSGANTSSSSYAFDILSSSDGVIKTTSGRTVHHQHQPSSDASPRLPKGGSAEVLAALGASKVSWKSFHVFVFSDCLLFGKAKKNGVYNFRFKVPLQPPFSVTTGQIAELPSLHGLSIQHPAVPNLRQPKTFCFRSSEECRAWAELLLFKLNTPRNAMLKPLLPPLPGQSFAAASSGTLPSPSSAQCLSGRSIQPSPKDKKQQHQQTSKTNKKKKKKYRLSQSGRHLRVRVKSERHDKGHHHNNDKEKEKEKEKDKDREKDKHLTGKKKSNRKRPPLLRHYSWGDSSTAINQLADGVALPSKGHKVKGKEEKEKDKAKDKDRERNEAEEPLMVLHKEKRTLNKNSNANKKNSKVATMQQGAPHRDKKDRAKQRASVAFFGHSSLASFDALAEAASSSSSATKTRSHTLENFRSVLPCVNSKDNNSASNGSNSSSMSSKDKDHKEGNKRNSQKPQKGRTSSGSGKPLQQ